MPGEYDDGRDRRDCELCDEFFVGGPTSTFWEMYDHDVVHHGGKTVEERQREDVDDAAPS